MNVVLRKTGNSIVITIPNKIKKALGAEIGEEIEKAMNQYDDLLKALLDK